MKKALPWMAMAALLLAACGSREQATQAPAGEPAQSAAPASDAALSQAAIDQAAAATQESVDDAEDPGDASLERLAAMPENVQLPGGRWKSGVHYRPIVPALSTSVDPDEVEVIEVFWLGCPHCYALEPYISSWKKTKPEYVKFKQMHVMWGPAHRSHARLSYTLEALGKGDTLLLKAFDEIHKRGNYLVANDDAQSRQMQLAFAKANGISEADFNREYSGFTVTRKLELTEDLFKRHPVDEVPVVIVNGKYQTSVTMAGGNAELIQLINDLAAFEKRR